MTIGTHFAAHWIKYMIGLIGAGAGAGAGAYIYRLRKERGTLQTKLLAAYQAKDELEKELKEAQAQLADAQGDGALRGERVTELEMELEKAREQLRQLEFTNVQLTAAIKVAEAQASAPAQTKNINRGSRTRGAEEPAAATGD